MTSEVRSPLKELTLWRVREFLREPEAIFWVFAFPVLLALALGIAFKNRAAESVKVAVADGPGAAEVQAALRGAARVRTVLLSAEEARNQLRTGKVSLVVVPGDPFQLQFDSTRQESDVARLLITNALQEAGGRRDVRVIRDVKITEPGSRYIDFLIPGLLGMNIMGTGMWGIGFGVVKSRQQKLLKRLLASPMRKRDYMLAHMLARLFFLAGEVVTVVVFAMLAFHVPFRGSVVSAAIIVLLGALCFAGLGLLVASRAKTIEGVSGLMNLVMVPMWICSGVFFASSRFPDAVQPLIKILPLTALNDALRAVMIDGGSLVSTAGMLGVIVVWGLVSFGAAMKVFRWT